MNIGSVGVPKVNERIGTPGYRWENNIKMDLKGRGLESADCISLVYDRQKIEPHLC
jgi:hypothetical protein